MTIGEVVSALSLYCSNDDDLLWSKGVDEIRVDGTELHIAFTDGNTEDVVIDNLGCRVR